MTAVIVIAVAALWIAAAGATAFWSATQFPDRPGGFFRDDPTEEDDLMALAAALWPRVCPECDGEEHLLTIHGSVPCHGCCCSSCGKPTPTPPNCRECMHDADMASMSEDYYR
jgi:hypothetical protein